MGNGSIHPQCILGADRNRFNIPPSSPPPSGNPRAFDRRPCPGVGHLNVKCQVFPTEYARFGGGVEFKCKQSTFRSKWLRKTIFTLKIDAYKRKTHQQNYFARFYNIFWSHKKIFQYWVGHVKSILAREGRNLLKPRIDQCITMIIFVKEHNHIK